LNPTRASLLVLACTFGASLLGIAVRRRIPAHRIEGDSRDVVKLILGLIASLTALVLGLLISSCYSTYQTQQAQVQQLGVQLFEIDRTLALFGPETQESRNQLRQMLQGIVSRVWSTDGPVTDASEILQQEGETLFRSVAALTPSTELQRGAKSRVLQLLISVGEVRHLMIAKSQEELSRPILWALVSWVTMLFVGFGLLARANAMVMAALLAGSSAVAGAVLLVVEMSQPYRGWLQLSNTPLLAALAHMGK
jgi:hypothetical protein